jgi:membrane fusion protein, multidrug efflux system
VETIMNHPVRNLPAALAVLLAASFFLLGCGKQAPEERKTDLAVPVIAGEASTRRVEYILHQVGSLEANQVVTVRSEIEGRAKEIFFQEGQEVKKGDILVRLDAAMIEAEIRNLEALIHQLQIRKGNKERNLERNRSLLAKDLVSRQQVDNFESEISEIDAQIVQAEADLSRQKTRLSYTTIRAPFDGLTTARTFSVGHYLKVGDPVVGVVNLDPIEISFQVPERLKNSLFPGQDVLLTVDSQPGQTFSGTIFFISPQVEVTMRSLQIKARVSNGQALLNPGMFARVQIVTDVHEDAVIVPWESVIQTEEGTFLYLVEGETARRIPVRLGMITDTWAHVLGTGLSPGQAVITEGKFAVKDGSKVWVKQASERQRATRP